MQEQMVDFSYMKCKRHDYTQQADQPLNTVDSIVFGFVDRLHLIEFMCHSTPENN